MPAPQTRDATKIMPNGLDRPVNVIAFPLKTVSHVLAKGDQVTNAHFDVALAHDHEEAAHFVQEKWDKISGYWTGTDQELDFLRAFLGAFAA